jgi:hypothetical protein
MQTNSRSSRLVKGIVIIIIIIALVSIAFILWTYPRSTLSFPVTFTIGAANQEKIFDVPAFDNSVQVQVKINNGASLWQASILSSNGTAIWSHQKAQGEQTIYSSDYFALDSGSYTFTFAALGAGSLDAQIDIQAKGGFW